jgi:hypothetical protein
MRNNAIGTGKLVSARRAGRWSLCALGAMWAASIVGCGGSQGPPVRAGSRPAAPGTVQGDRPSIGERPTRDAADDSLAADGDTDRPSGRSGERPGPGPQHGGDARAQRPAENEPPPRNLGDLLKGPIEIPRLPVDEARAAGLGIRKLTGKHLTLYTDLPRSAEIEALPQVFDLAAPQWAEYFGVEPKKVNDWRVTGFVMGDKERFREAGLLPDYLPDFQNGFTHGMDLWVYEQPSAYYRRHLLLHEGTHAFMQHILGAMGPPWYAEGMAELLATHRWQDGKLTLNYLPADKTETPEWGRIKIIRNGVKLNKALTLEQVMAYGPRAHLQVEPYGWCWGLAAMLDGTPAFRPAFRAMPEYVKERGDVFNRRMRERLGEQWEHALEQWQLFVTEADYGYDFARAEVIYAPGKPLAGATTVPVAADRGWQSSGVRVEAGRPIRLTATGRYQVGDQPKPWWCEAGGVTIEYYRSRPLGMLLCAVRDEQAAAPALSPLISPQPVGLSRDITFRAGGTLYFRINESPAKLADNQGELEVNIAAAP